MKGLVVVVAIAILSPVARADAPKPEVVALLTLDTGKDLEIYGQPVASEIARALVAGGIDVVVVGPHMAVPDGVTLIIDGQITSGKGNTVSLSVRIREPHGRILKPHGQLLEPILASVPEVTQIDTAASDLSSRLLPIVKDTLAALRPVPHADGEGHVTAPRLPTTLAVALVGTHAGPAGSEPLRAALATEADAWSRRFHHTGLVVEVPADLPKAVTAKGAELGVTLEIVDYKMLAPASKAANAIPVARAHVHVKIASPHEILFDREIVTDAIVGDRDMPADKLAARVAREVLDILAPHLTRTVTTWR